MYLAQFEEAQLSTVAACAFIVSLQVATTVGFYEQHSFDDAELPLAGMMGYDDIPRVRRLILVGVRIDQNFLVW